jgi:hypothetical protein
LVANVVTLKDVMSQVRFEKANRDPPASSLG